MAAERGLPVDNMPTRATLVDCALATGGTSAMLSTRTSPISRIGTWWRMAGGESSRTPRRAPARRPEHLGQQEEYMRPLSALICGLGALGGAAVEPPRFRAASAVPGRAR